MQIVCTVPAIYGILRDGEDLAFRMVLRRGGQKYQTSTTCALASVIV